MRHPSTALAVAAACLLTACTGSSPGEPGDGTRLRYLVEQLEDADALARLEDHLADFEDSSGIDVEVQQLNIETMRRELPARLRADDGPDVFTWGSGPGIGGALAEAGLLYDLTEAYEEHDWEVYDFARERVTYDGKVYGLPGEMETIGLYYDVEVFDELGLDPPRSLDDLRAVCESVRAAGLLPIAVGDQEGWEGGHLLSMALSSDLGADGMQALLAGERSWDSPEVADALRFWQEADQHGWLPESPTSVDYGTMVSLYLSGEAAMIPTGSWLIDELAADAAFESGYVPFPAPDGEGLVAAGLGSGPFVAARTDEPEAALALLDFLASEEHGEWAVENMKTVPPRPVDIEGLDVDPLLAQVLDQVSALSEDGGGLGFNIDVRMPAAFNQAMYDGVRAVLIGQASPEDVAAGLEAASQG